MATNVQINNLQENGQYEIIYPQTSCENIIDLSTNYYNKTETLQNNVAQLIGLSSGALPNDMFNVLSTIGDLYVWKRTQNGEVDYPVSVNPDAYQEGSDAQPAGYTLGETVNNSLLAKSSNSGRGILVYIANNIKVQENGNISLDNFTEYFRIDVNGTNVGAAQNFIKGKFFIIKDLTSDVTSDLSLNVCYFAPSDTTITSTPYSPPHPFWELRLSKYQPVTGYPAIPANTTIEYVGQVGDKARMQIVSYVGTGTYGVNNPCSITADFPIRIAEYLGYIKSGYFYGAPIPTSNGNHVCFLDVVQETYSNYIGFCESYYSNSYGKKSNDGKTLSWYSTWNSDTNQLNTSGTEYVFRCQG